MSEDGLRIPADISLIAFDDQPYSAYLAVPMTTVGQSAGEMGQIAVRLLFGRIESPDHAAEGGIVLPTTLVVRRSVRNLDQTEQEGVHRRVCG